MTGRTLSMKLVEFWFWDLTLPYHCNSSAKYPVYSFLRWITVELDEQWVWALFQRNDWIFRCCLLNTT